MSQPKELPSPTPGSETTASVLAELLRLYDWRFKLADMERSGNNEQQRKAIGLLNVYGREKKAAWEAARRVLSSEPEPMVVTAITVVAPDGSPVAAPCAISGCQYSKLSASSEIAPKLPESMPDVHDTLIDAERYRWLRAQSTDEQITAIERANGSDHLLDHFIDKGRCGL